MKSPAGQGLVSLQLQRHYDSDQDNVLVDFYRPVLNVAIKYRRAVGYFSAGALLACARELANFIRNDGQIRLIVGCFVSNEELAALPLDKKDEFEKAHIRRELIDQLNELKVTDLDAAVLLSRLIASGIAEIRVAVRSHGLYHEKYGIFEDSEGAKIAFIGSGNETLAAVLQGINHESFSAYSSADPEIYEGYGVPLEKRFENLWLGRARHTRVYELDDEVLAHLKEFAAEARQPFPDIHPKLPELNRQHELRDYQKKALRDWEANGCKGILAMATGTGKTLTAIEAVKQFRRVVPSGVIVITVPYQNLAVQWLDALREQGFDVIPAFQSYLSWYPQVKNLFLASQTAKVAMPCIVCVNDTFKDGKFQELLGLLQTSIEQHHLLIVDECHHFNKPDHITSLPSWFNLRLGLSATPYDQFAEHYLDKYFDRIVFEFSLSLAIAQGYLTKYRYHVISTELSTDETDAYEEITHKIVQIAGREESFSPETLARVQPLLLKRARIVGAARDKLEQLSTHLKKQGRTPFNLIYCGDGSLEDDGESVRQIELVSRMLDQLGWRASRITATETLAVREVLLEKLQQRLLDAIVSIKVLDEGIDVPVCRTAYLLASQTSDRQGIQRRGRVLRKSEGKEVANLYDFIVVGGATNSRSIKTLAAKEIRRAYQFARDAVNADELVTELERLQAHLQLPIGDPDGKQTQ